MTFFYRRISVGRPVRTYLHQLCVDTGGSLEALHDSDGRIEGGREREGGGGVREIRAVSSTR